VNVSGKVNVCCFDKTGTLTEDGLDILGVRAVDWNHGTFRELIDDVHDLPLSTGAGRASFLQALATCHMLRIVDSEIVGDPLDVKMFNFTQWTLEEGQVAGTGVIKDKASGTHSSTALVQTIVRPPGSASFRLEDALRGNTKVGYTIAVAVTYALTLTSVRTSSSLVSSVLSSSSLHCAG
jgi:cation-transporting ATPase 13A3/4/5